MNIFPKELAIIRLHKCRFVTLIEISVIGYDFLRAHVSYFDMETRMKIVVLLIITVAINTLL